MSVSRLTSAMTLLILASFTADAAQIFLADFGPSAVTQSFDGLDPSSFTETPIVIGSDTYQPTPLQYTSDPRTCVSGGCIATWVDNGVIEIVLGSPARKVGAFVTGLSYLMTWPIRGDFYDAANTLLGSVTVTGLYPPPIQNRSGSYEFVAFDAAADVIAKVRFTDAPNNDRAMVLDNFMVERTVVPIPPALYLFGAALGLMGVMRRQLS
jgi:hypothetical protein